MTETKSKNWVVWMLEEIWAARQLSDEVRRLRVVDGVMQRLGVTGASAEMLRRVIESAYDSCVDGWLSAEGESRANRAAGAAVVDGEFVDEESRK